MEGKLNKIWENKFLRYLLVFVGSALADSLICLYTYSTAHGWVFTQAIVSLILPFANLIFSMWFIDIKDVKERIKLTFVSSLGMMVGSTLILLLIKQ